MKIGAYEFLTMTGDVGSFGDLIEDETRPGLDGHTFRKLGKRGSVFQLRTKMTFKNGKKAAKAISDYNALQGTFVVLEDASGNSYKKVLVRNVSARTSRIAAATNDHEYLVDASWTLQRSG